MEEIWERASEKDYQRLHNANIAVEDTGAAFLNVDDEGYNVYSFPDKSIIKIDEIGGAVIVG